MAMTMSDSGRTPREIPGTGPVPARAPTLEELVEARNVQRRIEAQQMFVEYTKREKQRRLAVQRSHRKATDLLLRFLTPEQKESYRRRKAFLVKSQSGRTYLVTWGTSGNVFEMVEERGLMVPVASYCVYPEGGVPTPDGMLAQTVMLQNNERHFLNMANRSSMR